MKQLHIWCGSQAVISLPTTGPSEPPLTEMTAISKLGQWCGLYSTWVESVFRRSGKWSKWPSPDTRWTEWQLWGPRTKTPNTKHPGLSWHCALFPRDSSVTVFILIFLLQGPDFTKIHHTHFSLTDRQNTTRNFTVNMCNWSWRWYFWEI